MIKKTVVLHDYIYDCVHVARLNIKSVHLYPGLLLKISYYVIGPISRGKIYSIV